MDPRIGPQLSRHVSTFAQQTTNNTVQQAVRVLMLPGSTRGPNPWELTLIVMSALLAIGFLTSGTYIISLNHYILFPKVCFLFFWGGCGACGFSILS